MGAKSEIEWTDSSWNPIRGCTKVSAGCDNCYAMGVAYRFSGKGQPYEGLARKVNGRPAWTNVVREVPDHLEDPLRWIKPRRIFVNSMADLFHESLTDDMIGRIFAVMGAAPWHTYQVLTKRPERMASLLSNPDFVQFVERGILVAATGHQHAMQRYKVWGGGPSMPFPHVWLGTSVEDQAAADKRIPHLLKTPAAVRFLSCEPLLGPIDLSRVEWPVHPDVGFPGVLNDESERDDWRYWNRKLGGIGWVIVGGESGPRARPMHPDWARELQVECTAAEVPFFFKQWGEWAPDLPFAQDAGATALLHRDGRYFVTGQTNDVPKWVEERVGCGADPDVYMYRLGKHAAGRLLGGRTWNEMPEVRT